MIKTKDYIQLTKSFRSISLWIIISFAFAGVIGINTSLNNDLIFLIWALMAGTFHGLIQMHMLSWYTSKAPKVWFAITFGSALLGMGIVFVILKNHMINHALHDFLTISNNIPLYILKLFMFVIVLGSFIGSVIAVTQWFFARQYFNLLHWLFKTSVSWIIGIAIPLVLLFWLVAAMSG